MSDLTEAGLNEPLARRQHADQQQADCKSFGDHVVISDLRVDIDWIQKR